jgi:hypothetical protein
MVCMNIFFGFNGFYFASHKCLKENQIGLDKEILRTNSHSSSLTKNQNHGDKS